MQLSLASALHSSSARHRTAAALASAFVSNTIPLQNVLLTYSATRVVENSSVLGFAPHRDRGGSVRQRSYVKSASAMVLLLKPHSYRSFPATLHFTSLAGAQGFTTLLLPTPAATAPERFVRCGQPADDRASQRPLPSHGLASHRCWRPVAARRAAAGGTSARRAAAGGTSRRRGAVVKRRHWLFWSQTSQPGFCLAYTCTAVGYLVRGFCVADTAAAGRRAAGRRRRPPPHTSLRVICPFSSPSSLHFSLLIALIVASAVDRCGVG